MPTTPPNLIAGNFYKCNGGNSVPYIYMDNTLREVTTHEIGKLADYDNRDTWENAIKILPIGACDAIPRGDPLITSPYQNKMVQCEEDGSYSLITHGHRRPYATTRSDSEPAFLNPGLSADLSFCSDFLPELFMACKGPVPPEKEDCIFRCFRYTCRHLFCS